MRNLAPFCSLVLACAAVLAQDATPTGQSRSVTVPAVIDHNRVIVNVDISLPDGSKQAVRAWVDTGDSELRLSRRVATVLGLKVTCSEKECSSPPPKEILVGGLAIPLKGINAAEIPLRPVKAAAVLVPGMNAEINIPSTVLRHYDVLIDFPGHKFSIGAPGSIHFHGSSAKTLINPQNGLIEIPSSIENKKYNLALDLGSSISFLSEDLFDKLAAAHAEWPHITGAVGPANAGGADEETKWKVMRVDRVQFGPLFLTDVAMVDLPKATVDVLEKRAGVPTIGLIGSNMLLNYRVGLDYAQSTVYFDIGRLFNFPDFDVIGLVLRPEDDGSFTVLSVPEFEGKPAVEGVQPGDSLIAVDNIPVRGSTMGQVWSMLRGTPGQERNLTIERNGKQFAVGARVRHFIGVAAEQQDKGRNR
jgi:hypothetical protein